MVITLAGRTVGLAIEDFHSRPSQSGKQPMSTNDGSVISYNGEVHNYIDLKEH